MSESERVQRWRQRQREAGKKPLTIWVTDEEKLRLKHMLAQWQGESLPVTDTVTDTDAPQKPPRRRTRQPAPAD